MKYVIAIVILLLTIGCSNTVQVRYCQPLEGWPGSWILTDGSTPVYLHTAPITFDPDFCPGINVGIFMNNLADRANSKDDIWRFDWETMKDPEIRKFQLEFQCLIEKKEVIRNKK